MQKDYDKGLRTQRYLLLITIAIIVTVVVFLLGTSYFMRVAYTPRLRWESSPVTLGAAPQSFELNVPANRAMGISFYSATERDSNRTLLSSEDDRYLIEWTVNHTTSQTRIPGNGGSANAYSVNGKSPYIWTWHLPDGNLTSFTVTRETTSTLDTRVQVYQLP